MQRKTILVMTTMTMIIMKVNMTITTTIIITSMVTSFITITEDKLAFKSFFYIYSMCFLRARCLGDFLSFWWFNPDCPKLIVHFLGYNIVLCCVNYFLARGVMDSYSEWYTCKNIVPILAKIFSVLSIQHCRIKTNYFFLLSTELYIWDCWVLIFAW